MLPTCAPRRGGFQCEGSGLEAVPIVMHGPQSRMIPSHTEVCAPSTYFEGVNVSKIYISKIRISPHLAFDVIIAKVIFNTQKSVFGNQIRDNHSSDQTSPRL